jgi:hypothetical protein
MRPPIRRIKKGDPITARFLNDLRDGVEENRKSVKPPRQRNAPPPADVPVEAEDPETFIETTRTTSEVQVFDDEDTNYALIDRFETVSFENGLGETLKLKFKNP